jgi:hypothetical protein
MTETVSTQEIREAGGLQKWLALEMRKESGKTTKHEDLQDLGSIPAAKSRKAADLLRGYDSARMNRLEARYAERLETMKRIGEVVCWKFEEIKLRMAAYTFYTPDFFIMLPDGSVGFHETKGFWRDDARVKIKIAAELYPMFFFVAVQWDAKAKDWEFKRFEAQ